MNEFLKRSVLQKGMVNVLIFLKEVAGFVLWGSNIDNFLWEFSKIERQKLSQISERSSECFFITIIIWKYPNNYCTMHQIQ